MGVNFTFQRFEDSTLKLFRIAPFLLLTSLFLIVFLGSIPLAIAQNSCATDNCHIAYQKENRQPHPEEMTCSDCHIGDLERHGKEEEGVGKVDLAPKLCGDCHDDVKDHQYIHSPVAKNACSHCHNPHGNMENMLLEKENTRDFYINYSEQEYTLCFSCHKRDLLMYPETSFSTDFRDGIRNLHYLHITKGMRGRNCLVCHDIHGSNQPKLIANSVEFGNWTMRMGFIKTPSGGGCAPGCHRVKEYDRKIR